MAQQTYTISQLHQAFYDYLTKKFDGDTTEAGLFMETAERIIPNTLNDYFGTHIASIYDLQDAEEVESYRRKIKAEPVVLSSARRSKSTKILVPNLSRPI